MRMQSCQLAQSEDYRLSSRREWWGGADSGAERVCAGCRWYDSGVEGLSMLRDGSCRFRRPLMCEGQHESVGG